MGRRWIAALALFATACSSGQPVQCGACAGPGYVLEGIPGVVRHASVTVCLADAPCVDAEHDEPLRPRDQQPLVLPSGARWEDYDGRSVRVTVRAGQHRWRGTGTLVYQPPDGSPCDCGSFLAHVPVTGR